ncbi:MAG TPA: sugar phosphate isomerase/epimerase [Opitutaceae bacterium]|jgi:sugar phosphate isomerase/epimerase
MKRSQIGATLFTARDFCRTASDLAATARKLRAMGYEAVQHTWSCPVEPREAKSILNGEGLNLVSSHERGAMLLTEPEEAVERMRELGCTLTAFPYPEGVDLQSEAGVRDFARRLAHAGRVLRDAGMTLGYHNHDLEFRTFEGATILDFLFAEIGSDLMVAELDTYWVHVGGGDCVEWCRRLRGRLPFIHLKDLAQPAEGAPHWTEIGNGVLPFPAIVAAAELSGCGQFLVEQDTCPGDPFDSLQRSFDYLVETLT